jgi:hypothetical protein
MPHVIECFVWQVYIPEFKPQSCKKKKERKEKVRKKNN